MIEYEKFSFAAPPRTGSTWFIKACAEAGLGLGFKAKLHDPPPDNWNGYLVSLVRHPYHWLCSYYLSLSGGAIGNPYVDALVPMARNSKDLDHFIRNYLNHCPNQVSEIFDSYRAYTIMRVEDFPWAPIEFFQSVGAKKQDVEKVARLPAQNARKVTNPINKILKREVSKTERDFCERYEYY